VKHLKFKGIFLHFDNMELASLRNPEETRHLFDRLRDVFQIPDVYFVFVGQRGFFHEIISPIERVRSVFSGFPIHVPPLSKKQLLEAIQRRYAILAVQRDRFIRPVDDTLLGYLYDLYDGKMRFVFDAVTSIVTNLPHAGAETLEVASARTFLAELVIDRLQHELTGREWDVLKEAVRLGTFTNADIARSLKQQRQNISKYFNSLLDKRFIYPHHRDGRQIYYCASEDVRIIRDVPQKTLKKLLE
jgi:predicted transcriptional regulator